MKLTEIRPGLFLNEDQIVSVRVLPLEEDNAYAVLVVSSGDKYNLTRAEYTTITGEEPRVLVRPHPQRGAGGSDPDRDREKAL